MMILALHGKGSSPEKIQWLTEPLSKFGQVTAPPVDMEVNQALELVGRYSFDLIAGHSRGGTVALLAAARRGVPVIAVSAPSDRVMQRMHLCSYPDGTVQKRLCREQDNYSESYLRSTSPVNFADKITDALLVHGKRDDIVPISQSRIMCSRIRENGGRCNLVELEMKHTPPKSLEKELFRAVEEWIKK
ncbi:MAG: prolyl oligopeptidase family serine peptidase [Nitrososphaerota archaeon]|nr:prolyl oligopeptidase family serine peptidase [Nitrososphaerota archaeon]MDG6929853.1 prolyl oligopeptidase family serine peptidase [Nitrososphaerota archaeon]